MAQNYEHLTFKRELRLFKSEIKYCHEKPMYDKKSAETAKNRRWKYERIKLRIYQCPECDFWHLTSKV